MNAGYRDEASDSAMGSVMIAFVQERLAGGFQLHIAGEGPGVGPFAHKGSVEAFGFPVRLPASRSGAPTFSSPGQAGA